MRQLILGHLTGDGEPEWMQHLNQTANSTQTDIFPRLSDIQINLEEDENLHALVTYKAPTEEIAQELNAGESPAEALVAWQDFAESLIRVHSGFSSRMTVVECSSIPGSWETLVKHLREDVGIALGGVDTVNRPAEASESTPPALKLAASHLLTMKRANNLCETLESIRLPLDRPQYAPHLVEAYLRVYEHQKKEATTAVAARTDLETTLQKTREESKALSKQRDEIRTENTLLIEQLHKTQEELERSLLKESRLAERTQSLRRERDRRKGEVAKQESELRERAEKITWLRSVKNQHRQSAKDLRAKVRRRESQVKELELHIANLDKDLKHARREIKGLKNSRSWKYTSVLRKLNGSRVAGGDLTLRPPQNRA